MRHLSFPLWLSSLFAHRTATAVFACKWQPLKDGKTELCIEDADKGSNSAHITMRRSGTEF